MAAQPRPRKDTDPWLVYTLKDHTEKLTMLTAEIKKINGCLRQEIARSTLANGIHDGRIERQKERLEEHKRQVQENPKLNNPGAVTFKWVLEKLALPVIMLIVGGAIALLFG